MKCTETCKVTTQADGEVYCFAHGTVIFKRQAWDAMDWDESELLSLEPDNVYRMLTKGTLNAEELARELGYANGSNVLLRIKRWQHQVTKIPKRISHASLVEKIISS